MGNELSVISKVREIVLDIDPADVLNDARGYGLNVTTIKDLSNQQHNYASIEKLMSKYAKLTKSYCVASGMTSGVGGFVTTIALAGVDIANMAAQLYRLNQKMAILNGFNPENPIHLERSQMIYMKSLGFEGLAQAAIRSQVTKAAAENVAKSGPSANVAIRLVMEVAKLLGVKLSKAQAAKLIPFIGALAGGTLNYFFADDAAAKMMSEYKSDYFDRLQIRP